MPSYSPSPLRDRSVEALRRIQTLPERLTLPETLADVAAAIHDALEASISVLWVGQGPARALGSVGLSDGEAARVAEALGGASAARATSLGSPADHPQLGDIYLREGRPPIQTCLAAPLLLRGEPIGGIGVGLARTGAFEGDLPFVDAMAGAAALVIAALHAADTARRDAGTRRGILRRVAAAAGSLLTPEELVAVTLGELKQGLSLMGGAVYLVEGDYIRLVAHEHPTPEPIRGLQTVPLAGSGSAEMLKLKGPRQWSLEEAPPTARPRMEQSGGKVLATCPVTGGGVPLGLFHISRSIDRRFTEDELDLLASVCALIGPSLAAMQRVAGSAAELDRRGAELDALLRVADTLGRTLDLRQVLESSLDLVETLMAADSSGVYLLDEATDEFVLRGSHQVPTATAELVQRVPAERFRTAALERRLREPVLRTLSDANLPDYIRAALTAGGIRLSVTAPLAIAGRVIGMLSVGFQTERSFSSSSLRTLIGIAEQQAAAIDRALAHQIVEERAQLAAELRAVAERTIGAASGNDLLETLLDGVVRICGSPMARIVSLDGEGRVIATVSRGYPGELEALSRATGREDPMAARVLAAEEPVIVYSRDDVPPDSSTRAWFDAGKIGSVVFMPLRLAGRLVGVISSPSLEPRRFSPAQLEAIRLLASLATTALERERLRRAAELEQRRLGQLLDSLPIPLLVLGKNRLIEHYNPAYAALTASSPHSLAAAPAETEAFRMEVSRLDGTPVPSEELSSMRALNGERPEPVERLIKTAEGRRVMQVHAVPLLDDAGLVSAALVALQDVTSLRELADAKDRFLAIASHELRSPLASLNACVELLQLDPSAASDPARRDQLVGRIRNQITRLCRLVDDLIDTVRARNDTLTVDREPVDLAALAREAVDLAALQETRARVRADAPAPVEGTWDRHRLTQVIANLLGNALRYSPDGGEIVVSVRRTGGEALLAVRDQGVGIAPAHIGRLFEPFVRGRDAHERAPRGLGLGLFITHEIVRRHGGRIAVESEPGKGSLFQVSLPIVPPADPTP